MTDAIESTLADKRPRHPSTFHTGADPRHNNKAHAALHKNIITLFRHHEYVERV